MPHMLTSSGDRSRLNNSVTRTASWRPRSSVLPFSIALRSAAVETEGEGGVLLSSPLLSDPTPAREEDISLDCLRPVCWVPACRLRPFVFGGAGNLLATKRD